MEGQVTLFGNGPGEELLSARVMNLGRWTILRTLAFIIRSDSGLPRFEAGITSHGIDRLSFIRTRCTHRARPSCATETGEGCSRVARHRDKLPSRVSPSLGRAGQSINASSRVTTIQHVHHKALIARARPAQSRNWPSSLCKRSQQRLRSTQNTHQHTPHTRHTSQAALSSPAHPAPSRPYPSPPSTRPTHLPPPPCRPLRAAPPLRPSRSLPS